MKIRTDFVTNSSSASFVTYRITPGDDEEAFLKLKLLLERFSSKYEKSYIMNTRNYPEPLDNCSSLEITTTMYTPGLSQKYLDQPTETDFDYYDEEDKKDTYKEFRRRDKKYPPDVSVAIASLFGSSGGDWGYLSDLDQDTELLGDDGEISEMVVTHLTRKDAARLIELLKEVNIEQKEMIGSTD